MSQNLNGKLVTIFGGGGFLGRYVAQALMAQGARVRIAQRDLASAQIIKPLGNLGQVQFARADVRNMDSVVRAITGGIDDAKSDMVVNLVGSFGDLTAINEQGAANVASAATHFGCEALVHMSAIGASPYSDSRYGKSKGEGAELVRIAFPSATILRPSIVFGREDKFVNRFAGMIRMSPVIPVIGGTTLFQPVYVADVAKAVAAALADPAKHGGKSYDLGGPETVSMRALNEWIAAAIGHHPLFVDVPDFAAKALAVTTGWLPFAPINSDQLKMLAHDNVVDPAHDGFAATGLTPLPLDAVAHDWLTLYRKAGRFGKAAAA